MAGRMTFDESMSGYYSPLSAEPSRGFRIGQRNDSFMRGDFRITIDDMDTFVGDSDHEASLEGTITAKGLGEDLPIRDGRFNLFRKDEHGVRQMIYRFNFSAGQADFHFDGRKEIGDDHLALDAVSDMTTLFSRIFTSPKPEEIAPWAAGIIRFHLRDLPHLLRSIQTPDDTGFHRLAVVRKFFRFAYGELANTYLLGLSLHEPPDHT